MTIIKSIGSVFILLLFSIIISLSIQAQQQTNRNNTRQVGNMLQQLERSSSRFRNSLNVALVQGSLDQTQPQNDISTFQNTLTPPSWGHSQTSQTRSSSGEFIVRDGE